MNQHPFSRHDFHGNDKAAGQSFLARHCRHSNLSELAIVFGIGSVLSSLIVITSAVIIHLTVSASPIVGYSAAIIWFAFNLWFWVTMVMIGKIDKASRVSERELYALQILAYINIAVHAIFTSPPERISWHQLTLIFEWVIIGFHILYFLLALCIWVRVPWKAYIGFAIMLTVVIYQTMH